jgi:hypothetical protein
MLLLSTGCTTVDNEPFELSESEEPAPYEEDEFPKWMEDIRRAEIVFAGSLPFTILVSNAGYGIYNLLSSGTDAYDITSITSSAAMTNEEKIQVLAIGGGLSACIAIADFIIGLFETEENIE